MKIAGSQGGVLAECCRSPEILNNDDAEDERMRLLEHECDVVSSLLDLLNLPMRTHR